MASMVDIGVLDYDEKVCKYWPEFAQNEKQEIKVCDVLRHESGLTNLVREIQTWEISRDNIKQNSIGKIIEDSTPVYPKNTRRGYHTLTRGCILNEIFRRVEPRKRTMGEYLYQEINQKLQTNMYIGHNSSDIQNFQDLEAYSLPYTLLQGFVRKRTEVKPWTVMSEMIKSNFGGNENSDPPHQTLAPMREFKFDHVKFHKMFNESWLKTGELPSANGHCSARGMAKLAACVVNGGTLDGIQIMSKVIIIFSYTEINLNFMADFHFLLIFLLYWK